MNRSEVDTQSVAHGGAGEPLPHYIRRRLKKRMDRFAPIVARTSVHVTAVSGPGGVVDNSCRMSVALRPTAQMECVVIERQHHDARAAFDLALDAVRQAVRARVRRSVLERPPPHRARARDVRTARPAADRLDERIDAAIEGSFPASDPPPWTLGPPPWTST